VPFIFHSVDLMLIFSCMDWASSFVQNLMLRNIAGELICQFMLSYLSVVVPATLLCF
jgi:hypothetical protein